MRPLRQFSVLFLCCSWPFFLANAQRAPGEQRGIRKEVNLVLTDVIVTDPNGSMVSGLRPSDFEILDEGTPQEVVHFSQDKIPLAIALVVDVSGSMEEIMEPLRKALIGALPSLKSEDRVALFSFANSCRLELELTRDFSEIAKRIAGFGADGLTNINDAIYEATNYLRKRAPRGRQVIILISDTGANRVPIFTPAKEVERALFRSEVTLFGVRQGLSNRPVRSYDSWLVNVDEMAVDSGGFMVVARQPSGFQSAVESLIQILKTRYTLGFYPNLSDKPGSTRRLTVRLKNDQIQESLPGAILRYRKQYRVPTEKK